MSAVGGTAKFPALSVFPGLVLIIASLYWAQAFLIPLALSLLLTFLLTPLVAGLEKFGLGRVTSVMGVVFFIFSLLVGIAWIVALQFTSVANQLPHIKAISVRKLSTSAAPEKAVLWRSKGNGQGSYRGAE